MKVLHVVPTFPPADVYGGAVESAFQLCRALAGAGCEVRVLTTNGNGPGRVLEVDGRREVEVAGGLRVRYGRRVMRDSVSFDLLRLLLPHVRWADMVHLTAVYSFPTIPTLAACRVLGKPVVWSPRGGLRRWRGERRAGLKRLWELACRAAAPKGLILHLTSEEEEVDSRRRIPGVGTAVIPNGVEPPKEVAPSPGNGTLRLLYLGRLHPIKGIENLLEACALLRAEADFPWRLAVAGGGDFRYAEKLRERAGRMGLSERVQFLGPVKEEEKKALFEQSDVAVVPSFSESFGLVVAEALGWAVPVIAGRGTPWRTLEEKGCGLWVENDPRSLADAIGRIRRMPLREMGSRGREWMLSEFSWGRVAERMAALYRSLLRGRTGPPAPDFSKG